MGGGIAREIRNKYPQAYAADLETSTGDILKLGSFTTADAGKFLIVNAYTQFNTSQGEDVFEYESFYLILKKLQHVYGKRRFGLPYIGMGLARGRREWIIPMIENFAESVTSQGGSVTLVEFSPV